MSSLGTPHNKTGFRIWFDVEWFGTSLGQPEICPGWSAPSWCWPAPPAPSSRSPCPSPTRAPPPCQRHADTCLVTCSGHNCYRYRYRSWWFLLHYYSLLMQWPVFLWFIVLHIMTPIFFVLDLWSFSFGGNTILQKWNKNFTFKYWHPQSQNVLPGLILVCSNILRKVRWKYVSRT